jgi:hypothetical protein
MRLLPLLALIVALALPGAAAAGAGMFVGAAEDAGRSTDLTQAYAKLELARLAGFDTVRMTSIWAPGYSRPTDHELDVLRTSALAARLNGIRIILSVYQRNNHTTPLTRATRAQFASYVATIAREAPDIADFIIGNEPNLNLFWMPQFDKKGNTVSAGAYLKLLAASYDALKAVSPDVNVIGGSISPRGGDRAFGIRPTHSPTRFIAELGAAYRKSGRKKPVMDAFAFHPYLIPSKLPPTYRFRNPKNTTIALSDYDKLTRALSGAFKGTAQPGSTLPIVYDEFGYQSKIPADKRDAYSNLDSPAAADAIPEALQASYYRSALAIAQCQPNVTGMLIFHVTDEANASAWQSGVYYADDTPKSSLPAVRDAALAARDGQLARCPGGSGKAVNVLDTLALPSGGSYAPVDSWRIELSCSRACTYTARVVDTNPWTPPSALRLLLPTAVKGAVAPNEATSAALPAAGLDPGTYQIVVRVFETGRPGTAVVRTSDPLTARAPGPAPADEAPADQ